MKFNPHSSVSLRYRLIHLIKVFTSLRKRLNLRSFWTIKARTYNATRENKYNRI